ncbi:hypothetical protein BDV96DRAFT_575954 [Lophiotrema nucula]|uniref:peptidylprolyl isomerase n=1 Tax=Lophiotrema nucula TaxID=690887 RepID=A0A6A5Z8U8_9PLEO|nr:hypothetical protein BDV96DRAFT_575954 [Lophiotrema nucula]
MARYVVKVVAGGRTASLLVVLSPSALVSALIDKVKDRLPGLNLGVDTVQDGELVLHLDAADGPILDNEDLLEDALPDPKAETLFAVIGIAAQNEVANTQPKVRQALHQIGPSKQIRVRVITPELARSHPDVDAIPLLSADAVTVRTTLVELRSEVKKYLGVDYVSTVDSYDSMECNCPLALQIEQNASLNDSNPAVTALNSLIVVHGYNEVVRVQVHNTKREVLQQVAAVQLHDRVAGKHSSLIGGIAEPNDASSYIKLPVLAFCASSRHAERSAEGNQALHSANRNYQLDLHTAEAPIEITSSNAQVALAAAGLPDCMVNGVLNIYAVKRCATTGGASSQGKDAIFMNKDLAWEVGQSERGLANLLSSLRVLSDLTHASEMEAPQQDAVLHIINLLTRFPPAVRAVHTLMSGKTPRPSERAALGQSLLAILKNMIPSHVIRNDNARFFEGTRLLLGLVLEKAKQLKISNNDDRLVYMDTMKTFELRNLTTMEPAACPVQTISGLVDRGFRDAFQEGGLLRWTNGIKHLPVTVFERKLHRLAVLSGGVKANVVAFDVDAINTSKRYTHDIDRVIGPGEYSDLQHLAMMCSRNKLSVLPPSSLPSADPPVLTLDRLGNLAVYVGRQACGEAGRDIMMFRPTTSSGEESVDVSIITQLLVPVLNRRNADGTAVFEAFGDQHRRLKDPDEIVMLCVDCSSSMDERCGFIDVETNEDAVDSVSGAEASSSSAPVSRHQEDARFERLALDELKTFLAQHESFDDMIGIVLTGTDAFRRQKNAEKVLQILRQLADQAIDSKSKELDNMRRRATNYLYRRQAESLESDLAALKNRSIRLQQYQDGLCAFLLYRADNATSSVTEPLTWTVGATMPQVPKKAQMIQHFANFEIPAEFLCPISTELMEDPVTTVDNFTYERRNIERWLQTHESSPCTNLVLASSDVTPNLHIKEQIRVWIQGFDITSKYTSSSTISVVMKSPIDSSLLSVPLGLTTGDLYQLAWRKTKGRYAKFELHHRNNTLLPSGQQVKDVITVNHDVFIVPSDSLSTQTSGAQLEDLCLVKVYDETQTYQGHYHHNLISYWEPKSTTKTLASVVFRYYRKLFRRNPYTVVSATPFVLWTNLKFQGDNSYCGQTTNHWEPLSRYLTTEHCFGKLEGEPAFNNADEHGNIIASGSTKPLVLKIQLGSQPRNRYRHKRLTRLDVLKQMFDAFINRVLAYNFQTHIGLVTFRTTAALTQEITHAVENFRHQLNNITAAGDTALWDSIAMAHDQLVQYQAKFPSARLRIICLSDGEDTKSKQKVHEVSMKLWKDKILLDAFCLGSDVNHDLQALAYMTGGYKFHPNSMEQAMAICELEPVLSQLERPDKDLPREARRNASNSWSKFQQAIRHVELDEVSRDNFPERKQLEGLSESFVELGKFSGRFNMSDRAGGNLRLSRIHSEIRNSGAKVHPHYDIYICESNFALWKIVMQGPPGSSYANGTFLLYLEMGEEYPSFAPKARFITPVYHPNINRHGRICHSIFDRNWTVDTTNKDLIDTIYSLLLVPEFSDPINAVVTLDFHWDEVQFKEEASKHIAKHATKNRAQWKKDIVG